MFMYICIYYHVMHMFGYKLYFLRFVKVNCHRYNKQLVKSYMQFQIPTAEIKKAIKHKKGATLKPEIKHYFN
jgi:hypothetical protein